MDIHVTFPTQSILQSAPHISTIAHLEFALRAALVALGVEHPPCGEDDDMPPDTVTPEDAYALAIQNQILSLEKLVRVYRTLIERRLYRERNF
jgi:hypothetical protein